MSLAGLPALALGGTLYALPVYVWVKCANHQFF